MIPDDFRPARAPGASEALDPAGEPFSLHPLSPPLAGAVSVPPAEGGSVAASSSVSPGFSYRGLTRDQAGRPEGHPFFGVYPDPSGKTDPILARWLEIAPSLDLLGGALPLFVGPDRCDAGVYLLVRDRRVLYVGQSGQVRRRLSWHRSQRRNPFTREVLFAEVVVLPVVTGRHGPVDQVEQALIRFLRPPWNRMDDNPQGEIGELSRPDALLLRALGVSIKRLPRRSSWSTADDGAYSRDHAEILAHAKAGAR